MHKIKILALNFLVLTLLSACHKTYFTNGRVDVFNDPKVQKAPENTAWTSIVVLGLFEVSDPKSMTLECEGRGWYYAKTENNFLPVLLTNLTYGLYTPRHVDYRCM
jgi:hypothetical protein